MSSYTDRAGVLSLLTAVALAGLATACTPESPPRPPEPEPAPYYAPVPRDLCDRLRVNEIAAEFDLSVPPWYEPSDGYYTHGQRTNMGCHFSMKNDGPRFAAGKALFEPTGVVDVSIFPDQADTAHQYDLGIRGLEYRQEPLNATLAPAQGWWDEGGSSEAVREVPEGQYDVEQGEASRIDVEYVLRHENLYLRAHLDALSATEEIGEATAILHDLMAAMIEEIASYLPLTTDD